MRARSIRSFGGTKSNRLWKEILRGFEATGLVEAGGVELRQKQPDPSLKSQLIGRAQLDRQTRFQSYLDACQKAPGASAGTKRKWKRALGLL